MTHTVFRRKFGVSKVSSDLLQETKTLGNDTAYFMQNRFNVFRRRTERIQKRCKANKRWATGSMAGKLYVYRSGNITYCETPKTGCTFWKRIIRFLNHDYEGTLNSPLDISRHYVHSVPYNNTPRLSQITMDIVNALSTAGRDRIMFTRNPYSRIWSAYLDKLYLPSMWIMFGLTIIKEQRQNPTKHEQICGDTVTFQDFLRYVLPQATTVDWHFAPVQTVCDPCSLRFTYVGKQETFVNDTTYILKTHGLSSILRLGLFNNTGLSEIKSLAEANLNMSSWFPKSRKHCYNLTLVCERLWKVYQMNGYIGEDIPFSKEILKGATDQRDVMRNFISYVVSVYEAGRPLHGTWRKQRRESLVKAYRSLPRTLLLRFQRTYNRDFTIFGYEKRPKDIFE